jgi:hypothetical protein
MAGNQFAIAVALLVVGLFALAAVILRGSTSPPPPPAPCKKQLRGVPNWGSNIAVFDPSMPMATIMDKIVTLYKASSEFSSQRVALFFMPGTYTLSFKVNVTQKIAILISCYQNDELLRDNYF